MSDADKIPAQCATVQGKDSPCAVQERARLRAMVQKEIEYWQSDFVLRQFFGHIAGLRRALTMIDAEDTTND
jgi:hypothetical protein